MFCLSTFCLSTFCTCISHPAPGAQLSLAVDASDSHIGGVLQQHVEKGCQPLAFFSKKLSPTEAVGGLLFHQTYQVSVGGETFQAPHGSQVPAIGDGESYAAVFGQTAAASGLHL
jgi:hypothetical protein